MIPYAAYKVLHLTGILVLFAAVGATGWYWSQSPDREATRSERRFLYIVHGLATFVVLVGGFGLLARIGVKHNAGWPAWVYPKLVVWGLVAASVILFKRMPHLARPLVVLVPLVGAVAAYFAIYKPT